MEFAAKPKTDEQRMVYALVVLLLVVGIMLVTMLLDDEE